MTNRRHLIYFQNGRIFLGQYAKIHEQLRCKMYKIIPRFGLTLHMYRTTQSF